MGGMKGQGFLVLASCDPVSFLKAPFIYALF